MDHACCDNNISYYCMICTLKSNSGDLLPQLK